VGQPTSQTPSIVHSSFGRLRVHQPDPEGIISHYLRSLPGVHSAEANRWTGNILILYNAKVTSELELLGWLEGIAGGLRIAAAPVPQAPQPVLECAVEHLGPHAQEHPGYVTGLRRIVYKTLGWASVGMAVVGAILPGIPTVPFVVLAGYFFMRSSPAAHDWLMRSRWFGTLLREWEQHRGVRPGIKLTAIGLMAAGLVITLLIGMPIAIVVTIVLLELIGLVIIVRLPVIESPPLLPATT